MIKDFHEQYPHIDFQLINGEYNQITNWLRRGLVDCGFVSLLTANDLDASFLLQGHPGGHPAGGPPAGKRPGLSH